MTGVVGDPEGYALAWEEGRSGVLEQTISLRDLRDRAGTIVTIAAAVIGLGLALVLDDGRGKRLDALGVAGGAIAFLGFMAIVAATVFIWRPFPGRFVRDPTVIIEHYIEGDDPLPLWGIHRELAGHLGGDLRQLSTELEVRLTWFTRALWALLALHGGLAVMILDVTR